MHLCLQEVAEHGIQFVVYVHRRSVLVQIAAHKDWSKIVSEIWKQIQLTFLFQNFAAFVSQAGFSSRDEFLGLLLLEMNEIKSEINEATAYRNTMKLQKTFFHFHLQQNLSFLKRNLPSQVLKQRTLSLEWLRMIC